MTVVGADALICPLKLEMLMVCSSFVLFLAKSQWDDVGAASEEMLAATLR
ncbi:hypothetical protein [Mesorhizobium sp. M0146]